MASLEISANGQRTDRRSTDGPARRMNNRFTRCL